VTQGEAVVASAGWDVGAFTLLYGYPDDNEMALFDLWDHPHTLLLYSKKKSSYGCEAVALSSARKN